MFFLQILSGVILVLALIRPKADLIFLPLYHILFHNCLVFSSQHLLTSEIILWTYLPCYLIAHTFPETGTLSNMLIAESSRDRNIAWHIIDAQNNHRKHIIFAE